MVKRTELVVSLIVSVGWSGMSVAAWPSDFGTQIAIPMDPASVGYLNLTKRHPMQPMARPSLPRRTRRARLSIDWTSCEGSLTASNS